MRQLQCGTEDGRRWICGQVPMRKNVIVEIDTRTGKGMELVLEHMSETIRFHANKMKLPSSTYEDLAQELRVLVLSGVAEYDITKETNLMTFLQNHLRNRIVNLYKFATERCRTPIHDRYRLYKVRCPKCRGFSLADESAANVLGFQCRLCGKKRRKNEDWKKYPVLMMTFSSDVAWHQDDSESASVQDLSSYEDLAAINFSDGASSVDALISRIALHQVADSGAPIDRLIIQHLLEGRSLQEICEQTALTMPALRAQIASLAG